MLLIRFAKEKKCYIERLKVDFVILYVSGRTYSLMSSPNNSFEKLFMAILFTRRVSARNLLSGGREEIFSYFRFDV